MKRTTKYRRSGPTARPLAWALAGACVAALLSATHSMAQAPETAAVAQAGAAAAGTELLASIRAAAESYVKSLIPPGTGESIVTAGALDARLRLAHCPAKELSASLTAGMTLQARSTVGVTCAGPVHWTVYVPVTIESKINVLVLVHAVNRDARLTPGDVTVETRRTAGPGNAYLTEPSELSGRTVRRPLAAGTTLAVDMFSPDLIVHRGQQVTLLSAGGMIEVRASGRAMTDGAQGARIPVQNLSSMRVIEGVVESADLVRVAQ
jgi:flagellar basal body P-ring formation protein FlgA